MTRGRTGALLLAALLLPFAAFPVRAQRAGVEELCRLHGVGAEGDIVRIKEQYLGAVRAGISEEELGPFLEDILRHKLDCGQMVRVLSVTTRMQEEGLPYFVVFSKVREGVAKEAPPALVVEAAEAKHQTLTQARDVLISLESSGYRVRDYRNAAVIVSSYIERGYPPGEIVSRIRAKGVGGSGFAALNGVLDKTGKRKER